MEHDLIKRAIGSGAETSTCPLKSVTYERRSSRVEVDGVQSAAGAECVRGDPVKYASAPLEAQIPDTERCPVFVDRADRGDQSSCVGIDLDQRAGVALSYS